MRRARHYGQGAKPAEIDKIDATIKHLRNTLRKNKKGIPPCQANMLWRIVEHWFHLRLRGHSVIHPGRYKVAKWGNCGTDYAKTFLRDLRENQVLAGGDDKGGRGNAREYVVSVEELCRYLMLRGVKMGADLVSKLLDADEMTSRRSGLPLVRKGGLEHPENWGLKGGKEGGPETPPFREPIGAHHEATSENGSQPTTSEMIDCYPDHDQAPLG